MLRRFVSLGFALAVVVGVLTAPSPASAGGGHGSAKGDFTLVVLPDTQLAVQNKPELFEAQTQWILDNRKSADIPFVVHVGDVVEWPSRVSDWERAARAMYPLNRKVPYAIALGNHDFDAWACTPAATCNPWSGIATDRSTDMFNTYFPRRMFEHWPSFGGGYPRGSMDNTYFELRAGDVKWLVVSLKFDPTADELDWANRVIARHPHHQVMINTHEYQSGVNRSAIGERIWNDLARKHKNIQFVFSGHYTAAGTRIDHGDHGNSVYGIQADYQTYSIPQVNDNSYLRLMRFDTKAGTIEVKTFSPWCEKTGECPAYRTEPNNEFTLTGVTFPTRR
ncbi:metallophosphoesterase [Actinomadura sp. HBU206391]|uniref:metallophosphoesterase n=1 Tax=Actinomadura sp. HBU206391 TaxID=2731692 RepID=UPI00164F7ECB|nr:metallophosphoesterase [Actinomadura sp. HBU206391]MBC6457055.1 metallophosphoesterase [Actinomadura sp. HBU206391]